MDRNGFANFMLGLGVGIGLGMLFAPKSGDETRRMIREKAGESKDFIRQRGTELRDSANDLLEKSKEALGRQRDNLSDALEAGRQAYRDTVGKPPSEETAL